MPKKKPIKGKPEVHEELKGFDIQINEFGEIKSNYDVENINNFLNENTEDKKLKEQGETQKEEE